MNDPGNVNVSYWSITGQGIKDSQVGVGCSRGRGNILNSLNDGDLVSLALGKDTDLSLASGCSE